MKSVNPNRSLTNSSECQSHSIAMLHALLCRQRFLSCVAFCIYEVVYIAVTWLSQKFQVAGYITIIHRSGGG